MIIPEDKRVCEWHLYQLAEPIARQLRQAEQAQQDRTEPA
jgi:hypothetical protein